MAVLPRAGQGCAQRGPQKAPLPVKEARVEVTPTAFGDRPGSTSLMLSGETEPFIMLAAMPSWLCSLATSAVFSSSCRNHGSRQQCSCKRTITARQHGNPREHNLDGAGETEPVLNLEARSSWVVPHLGPQVRDLLLGGDLVVLLHSVVDGAGARSIAQRAKCGLKVGCRGGHTGHHQGLAIPSQAVLCRPCTQHQYFIRCHKSRGKTLSVPALQLQMNNFSESLP